MFNLMISLLLRYVRFLVYIHDVIIMAPINYVWNWVFRVELSPFKVSKVKIVVVETSGLENGVTLARSISRIHHHKVIDIDRLLRDNISSDYPYDLESIIDREIEDSNNGTYIIDGRYSRPNSTAQQIIMERFIDEADLVLSLNIPVYVSVWRVIRDSFQRMVGIDKNESHGVQLRDLFGRIKEIIRAHRDVSKSKMEYVKSKDSDKVVTTNWPYHLYY